ncbi:MAG: hypothetical protein WCC79_03080, partial [Nitrososphaeraceae archaeon]
VICIVLGRVLFVADDVALVADDVALVADDVALVAFNASEVCIKPKLDSFGIRIATPTTATSTINEKQMRKDAKLRF